MGRAYCPNEVSVWGFVFLLQEGFGLLCVQLDLRGWLANSELRTSPSPAHTFLPGTPLLPLHQELEPFYPDCESEQVSVAVPEGTPCSIEPRLQDLVSAKCPVKSIAGPTHSINYQTHK